MGCCASRGCGSIIGCWRMRLPRRRPGEHQLQQPSLSFVRYPRPDGVSMVAQESLHCIQRQLDKLLYESLSFDVIGDADALACGQHAKSKIQNASLVNGGTVEAIVGVFNCTHRPGGVANLKLDCGAGGQLQIEHHKVTGSSRNVLQPLQAQTGSGRNLPQLQPLRSHVLSSSTRSMSLNPLQTPPVEKLLQASRRHEYEPQADGARANSSRNLLSKNR